MHAADVAGGQFIVGPAEPSAERIEPGVEDYTAAMGLFDPESERVSTGGRSLTLLARQIVRPGLKVGAIERIGGGADLEHDGIEPQRGRAVEDGAGLGLPLGGREPRLRGPVDIGDRGHPDRAKLARRRRRIISDHDGGGDAGQRGQE